MENSKIWIPEKKIFVLLLPLMAHKSNGGIIGLYKGKIDSLTTRHSERYESALNQLLFRSE